MRKISLLFIFILWVISLNAQSIKKLYNESYIVNTKTTYHVNSGLLHNNGVLIIFGLDRITLSDGTANKTVLTILNKTIINKSEIYYQCYSNETNRPVKVQVKKEKNNFYIFVEISNVDELFLFKTNDVKKDVLIRK